jgi:hypothetical protein
MMHKCFEVSATWTIDFQDASRFPLHRDVLLCSWKPRWGKCCRIKLLFLVKTPR